MTAVEFITFFSPWELVKIYRLCKASYHMIQVIVNFEVLYETQGIKLTPAEV